MLFHTHRAEATILRWRCAVETPVTPAQEVQQAVARLLAANPLLPNPGPPMDTFEFGRFVAALIALIDNFDELTKN